MQTSTLRPGLLVSLATSVQGNARYRRQDIEADHITDNGERRASWETERTISDPVEYESAIKVRSKARSLITSVCAMSAHGLLCLTSRRDDLDRAVTEAQALARDFNRNASLTSIRVNVIVGEIAADDVQATKAINQEVRDLLEQMERGVRGVDVKAIRDAANKARELSAMITPEASERLQKAIDAARSAARRIVKAAETAAMEVDQQAIRAISAGRTAFLDLDGDDAIATPTVTGRALDMEPQETIAAPIVTAPRFEF